MRSHCTNQYLELFHSFYIRFFSHMANRMTVGSPVRMQLVALPKPEEETKAGMRNAKFMYLRQSFLNPVSIYLYKINSGNRIMSEISNI